MAHCTEADVQFAAGGAARLRQLSDWSEPPTNRIDSSVVAAAIAEADAMVDSKIQIRHAIPTDVVETIRRKSARIAVYCLKRSRGMLSDEDIKTHELDAAWLAGFKGGETTLGVDPVPEKSEYVGDAVTDRPTDKAVSRYKLRGYA